MKESKGDRANLTSGLVWIVLLVLTALATPLRAENFGDELAGMVSEGEVDLSFRYRFEFVDHENFGDNAEASTLRTRLTLQSGELRGFDGLLEFDDIRHLLQTDFNSAPPPGTNNVGFPRVGDPKGTEVNQAYLDYSGFDSWLVRGGRQRINFDNQRFVGGVGWRQNEQTFDGARVNYGNDRFKATYSIVRWVRRIWGSDFDAGRHKMDATQLLNLSYDSPIGKIAGYYYYIDNETAANASNQTLGARLTGKWAASDKWGIRYEAEFARQSDVGNSNLSYKENYWHLVGAAVLGDWDLGLGWELLGGDADAVDSDGEAVNESFRTPLATLHKFNGWADLFLTTPRAGLDDRYLRAVFKPGKWNVDVRYHDFRAEDGGDRYGTEFDVAVAYKFTDRFTGLVKAADFSSKEIGFPDVTKFWIMVQLAL